MKRTKAVLAGGGRSALRSRMPTAAQAEGDQTRKEAAQACEAAGRLSRQIAAHQERAAVLARRGQTDRPVTPAPYVSASYTNWPRPYEERIRTFRHSAGCD